MNSFNFIENGQFTTEIPSDFKFPVNKELKNLVNTGQGHICVIGLNDILTLIPPFSKLLSCCYNVLFVHCYCVLLLFW